MSADCDDAPPSARSVEDLVVLLQTRVQLAHQRVDLALDDLELALDSRRVQGHVRAAIERAVQTLRPSSGPTCRVCGCTDADACADGCGWAEPEVCTACAPDDSVRDRLRVLEPRGALVLELVTRIDADPDDDCDGGAP